MTRAYPDGPKGKFLIGNLTDFIGDSIPFMVEAASYGDIAHFRLGPYNAFLVKSPEYVHTILVKHADKFVRDPISRSAAKKFIGNGLVATEGETHRYNRKLMQPAFHPKRLETYLDIMVSQTQRMLDRWEEHDQVILDQEMPELTLKLVCQATLSADVSDKTSRVAEAMADFQDVLAIETRLPLPIPDWLPIPRKRRMKKSVQALNSVIKDIIEERRKSNEDHGDLLSMMMMAVAEDDGGKFDDQQVHDEAVTLLIAGHETTASVLTWAPYLLAKHPEVEAKLHQELDEVLGGRIPTLADLSRLTYLEQVIKETLRLYPPGWIFGRTPLEPVEVGPYTLQKGDLVFLCPYVTHRDERYYEDPEAFKPERFTADFEKSLPRMAYFPFSGGIHVCLGQHFAMMETKVVLSMVLQQYRLLLATQEAIRPTGLATLRPHRDLEMKLVKRTQEQPLVV